MKFANCLRLGAVVGAFVCGAANANLLTNGSFESETQASGTWSIYPNLTGWTGGPGGIELRNNVAGAAYDGVNYVELDTTTNSLAYQGVTGVGSYVLSFAYSAREGVSAASNGIEVFWNGLSQGVFTGSGIGQSGNNWEIKTLNLTGIGSNTLSFNAVGTSDSYGGSLDAVSLTAAIPEPGTYALMLAGLGAIGFIARRRRPNQG
jgi:hypothetical protein